MFSPWRSALLAAAASLWLARPVPAQIVVYDQPSDGAGFVVSSWLDPDGSDADLYAYDNFTLANTVAITDIRWRGGYSLGGLYGHAWDYTITFFGSTVGGTQPYCGNPQLPESPYYLAHYQVGGTAGETQVGTSGGLPMFEYSYTFPTPFVAAANTTYWVRIQASQIGYPDWGVATGSGPDHQHYQFSTGAARFSFAMNDCAVTLLSSAGATFTISASEAPPGAGTIAGAGPYPDGSLATLVATANPGYTFVDWTEGGATVSTSPTYAFTVTADRTLVANFAPAFTIAISDFPGYGGTSTGGGIYASGSTVDLMASPSPGFVFVNWTEFGTEVSMTPAYSFTADMDRTLVANYTPSSYSAWFDFDTGWPTLSPGQGIPLTQVSSGVTAHVSSPEGSAFSIQTDGTTHWSMSQFSGNYVYPNNQNRNTLVLQFEQQLTAIYLTFATADNHQTELTTQLLLSAYLGAVPVGTATKRATYGTDTFPMGTIGFQSASPFDRVELVLPYQPLGVGAFFVDNILVALYSMTSVPEGPVSSVRLLAPAPNPSRGELAVAFELPAAGRVDVGVFDIRGRRVRTLIAAESPAGRHDARWDGRDASGGPAPAGAYFIRLESAGVQLARKAVVIR